MPGRKNAVQLVSVSPRSRKRRPRVVLTAAHCVERLWGNEAFVCWGDRKNGCRRKPASPNEPTSERTHTLPALGLWNGLHWDRLKSAEIG
jgi:hypothetical protein